MVSLNETPVRTARNFNINNIKLNDIKYIENLKKFDNIKITGLGKSARIEEDISNYSLKYGILSKLEENIKKSANSKLRLILDEKSDVQIDNIFDEKNLNLVQDIQIIVNPRSTADVIIKYKRIWRF